MSLPVAVKATELYHGASSVSRCHLWISTMANDTTRAIYLIKLVEVLEELGYPVQQLFLDAGITANELLVQQQDIAMRKYLTLLESALTAFAVPDLGFRVGEHTSTLEHGVLGYALLSANTFQQSLQRYERYQYLQGPLLSVRLETDGNDACLVAKPLSSGWRLSHEMLVNFVQEWLVGWNQWAAFLTSKNFFFDHIELGYHGGDDAEVYREHLGCDVSFGYAETRGRFSKSLLQQPIEFADSAVGALCAVQCERLLEVLHHRRGLSADIHRHLVNSPGTIPNMESMARKLFVSPRTLRRHLRDEGTTYQKLVIEFRLAMAKRYLAETQLPANEIAALVGYADSANFYRTFVAAEKLTPQQYRRRNNTSGTLPET